MVPPIHLSNLEEKNSSYRLRLIKEKMDRGYFDTTLATTTFEKLYPDGKEDIGYTAEEIKCAVSKNFPKVKMDRTMPKDLLIIYTTNIIKSKTAPGTDIENGIVYYFKK